ncbi:hypothetical protein BDV25DRAFT_142311 [Aspergillus avenaceus]|uniref:Uncharacterized protein n=1 Tax=Aspergillus avenaceus TaxID=36643 RepID=A0A5N6TNE3_ASPAV|nr:hypothetical protein BDV25DRAFT_142311 [Aspergillus avenaceus]
MKIFSGIPALFALSTVNALPSIIQYHFPNATWEFSLYQNNHCTGEITLFYGTKGTPCRDAILNGGALGYINNKIADSNCTVHLFNDSHCSRNRTVDILGNEERQTCLVPTWEGSKTQIKSYYVRC